MSLNVLERDIFALNPSKGLKVGLANISFIRLNFFRVDTPKHYKATYTPTMDTITQSTLKISPYLRSRKVLTAQALPDAIKGCDTYAKQKVVHGPMSLGYV
jgi:hypothetical protein